MHRSRPGGKTGKDERKLGETRREISEMKNENLVVKFKCFTLTLSG